MNDPRAAIFRQLDAFEASIAHLPEDERRAARVALVRGGMDLYRDECQWRRSCRPSFGLLCLIPVFWPVLWYRGQMSKTARSAIAEAIRRCRDAWPEDLADAGLDFEGMPGQ